MRATAHNGRWGSAKHNGRDFDLSKADHIDAAKSGENIYWTWADNPEKKEYPTFEDAERAYYDKMFTTALAQQNDRHRAARNYKRVRSMEDVLQNRNERPEETILQIGNKDAGASPDVFADCVWEYVQWEQNWSEEHGCPFQLLDLAVHLDETSPHAHQRRVWQYQEDGVWMIGQNKALEAAGVPLPDPAKPVGKHNNRKMTFDAMCREKWLDICEEHGIEVQREADESHTTHLPKEQFIALQEREAELSKRETALQERETALDKKEAEAQDRLQELHGEVAAAEAHLKAVKAAERAAAQKVAEYRLELAAPVPDATEARFVAFAKRTRLKSGRTLYEAATEDMQREDEAMRGHKLRSFDAIVADAQKMAREVDCGTGGRNQTRDNDREL